MASISSLGVGSGLDLSGLVENLLAAERAPIENSLNRQQAKLVSDLSGVGLMKASLSGFQSSLSGVSNASSFSTRTISNNNTDALTASTDNTAEAGTYNIDINTLASSQSLASAAYSSTTDIVGTGTIQIRFGTITGPGFSSFAVNADKAIQNITIDATNNTLAGLKDTINDGDYGVTAAIVNDGSGFRLTLTSDDTGASNAMEISITDTGDANDTDASGLSALAYNALATNLTETQTATDASIAINGLAITSQTNTLTEVIEGVTLNLQETTVASLRLTVDESSAQLKKSIRDVVEAYNEMIVNLNDLSSVGSTTTQAGILFGDASLRNFTNGLFRVMTSPVDGLDGDITALSSIGITTQADGTLAIDEGRFSSVIDDNPVDAVALFAPLGQSTDSLINFNASTDSSIPGNYAVNITAIATQAVLNGGTGVNNLTIDANNDNFTLSIDGISSGNISLTQGTYATATALAAEIQSQINSAGTISAGSKSVAVSYDGTNDRFVLTSDAYGSSSTIEITAVDTNSVADLGLSVATGTAGVDVAGSIGGVVATGSGQTLSTDNGLKIDVLGGTTGSRGSIGFSRGFIDDLNDLLDGYLDVTGGSLAAREDGLNASLENIADERIELDIRIDSIEARLVKQFTALDILLAEFQNTGNFLSQQINSLPGSGQLLNKK